MSVCFGCMRPVVSIYAAGLCYRCWLRSGRPLGAIYAITLL